MVAFLGIADVVAQNNKRKTLTKLVYEIAERMDQSEYRGLKYIYGIPFKYYFTSAEGCERMIVWNYAARKLYEQNRPKSYCYLEIGPNGIDHFNKHLKELSIEHQYQKHVLYIYLKHIDGIGYANWPAE